MENKKAQSKNLNNFNHLNQDKELKKRSKTKKNYNFDQEKQKVQKKSEEDFSEIQNEYEIIQSLGTGSYGTVVKVETINLGKGEENRKDGSYQKVLTSL
jgi:hypothetical protein